MLETHKYPPFARILESEVAGYNYLIYEQSIINRKMYGYETIEWISWKYAFFVIYNQNELEFFFSYNNNVE